MQKKQVKSGSKTLQNFTVKNEEKVYPIITGEELKVKFSKLMQATGVQHEVMYNQIKESLDEEKISYVKERNVLIIQEEILKYINDNKHGLPSVTRLALKTKLSRVTVSKYLKEILNEEFEEERRIQHKYIFDVILTNLSKRALSGDLRSSKLYLDTMIRLEEKESIKMYIKNQQNNITINP